MILKVLISIVVLPIMIFVSVFIIYPFLSSTNLSVKNKSTKTTFIFNLNSEKSIYIKDEHSKVIRAFGAKPVSIKIENGMRKVIFTEPAILKTKQDSIEPRNNSVKLKGYMGVTTYDSKFTIDSKGIISSDNWHGG